MMAGPGGASRAGGGPARHIPVLLEEVVAALQPGPGKLFADGTFGAGGYSRALLERGARVIAVDRDPDAIAAGRALEASSSGRLRLAHDRFSQLAELVSEPLDGVVLDIGVSSMQLDEAERGFSFREDGPLDMRMAREGLSAADVVNGFEAGELTRIFGLLGEERHAGRVARAIERRRAEKPFATTLDLAQTVERAVGRHGREKIHPATRVFQGLRIFVNDELGELAKGLFAAEALLKPGGVLAVVTFHSLEDRVVKRFMASRSAPPGGSRYLPAPAARTPRFDKPAKAVEPSPEETAMNPRARSARLRSAQRTGAAAGQPDYDDLGLPGLARPDMARPYKAK